MDHGFRRYQAPQGVHCSSTCTVNIHVRAQKGYYIEQACTKCTYNRHIKQEVDIHEAGYKAIEKYMESKGLCIYAFKTTS